VQEGQSSDKVSVNSKVRVNVRKSRIALAFAAGLAASPVSAATNLVTNGDFTVLSNGPGQISEGFSTTIAQGWNAAGYNVVLAVANQAVDTVYGTANVALWDKANGGNNNWNGLAPKGNILALDGDFGSQTKVSQTITNLTAGKTYILKFDYAFGQQYGYNGATIQHLTAEMGSTVWISNDSHVADHGFSGWSQESLEFTASSASEVLSFLAYGNVPVPPFALVGDVSITSVPELSTWALMLVGFAGLAYARRVLARRESAEPVRIVRR
jgi:hypothetical protein